MKCSDNGGIIMKKSFIIFILFFVVLGSIYDIYQFKNQTHIQITEEMENNIQSYLDEEIFPTGFNAYEILGAQKNKIYIYAVTCRYNIIENRINIAWQNPYVLTVKNAQIVKHDHPSEGGDELVKDMKKMFPPEISQKMYDGEFMKNLIENLHKECEEKASK
jgi:hypothetical protein